MTPPPIYNTRVLPHMNKTDKTDVDRPPVTRPPAVNDLSGYWRYCLRAAAQCSRCCYGGGGQPGLGTPAAAV